MAATKKAGKKVRDPNAAWLSACCQEAVQHKGSLNSVHLLAIWTVVRWVALFPVARWRSVNREDSLGLSGQLPQNQFHYVLLLIPLGLMIYFC